MAFEPKKEKGLFDSIIESTPGVFKYLPREGLKRTMLGAGLVLPREALELGRMITNPDKEKIEEQEKGIENILGYMAGSENVENQQRGEEEAGGYSVAGIKQPKNELAQIVRLAGGLVGGVMGAGKFVKGAGFLKSKVLPTLTVPTATSKVGKAATSIGKYAGSGAGASQIGFNPYEEQLGEWIGEFMPEEAGWQGDLKEYLVADRQTKSQLENRIDLLAEGALLGLGVGSAVGLFKGGKFLTEVELNDKFKDLFKKTLDGISNKGEEHINNFLSKFDYKKSDAAQARATLAHRQKDIIDGKVVDIGDIEAMKPSKYTRWISDVNLQFSSSPLLRKLENFRTKLFSTRGGRTRQLNEKFLRTENIKEKWTDNINNIAYNLESSVDNLVVKVSDGKWFGSNRKENKDIFLQKLNDVLYTDFRTNTIVGSKRGISVGKRQKPTFEKELQKNFPKEMWDDVRAARRLQDNLSKLMLESNTLTNAQKEIYKDSLGFYVRKSYKLYEDNGYVPTKDVKNEAREYLSKQIKKDNPTITSDDLLLEVDSQMNVLLSTKTGGADSFGANLTKFDRVRKEILKGRKDIPPAIKNLLGEIENPIQSLILSTTKLSKYVEDTKFYNESFDEGGEIYFKTKELGVFKEVIPEGFGNLSGKFTTPEMKEYFSNHKKMGQDLLELNEFSMKGGAAWMYRSTLLLKGISQAAKTVWSHTTHFKNIIGGNHMSLANGINTLSPSKALNIIRTLNAKTSGNKAAQAYHEEMSGRGLLNKGVVTGDIQALSKDNENVKKGFVIGKLDWAFNKAGLKWTAKKAQNAYIKEDDFFKVNMYETEQIWLKDFNAALPVDSKFNKYRFKDIEAIKDEAAFMTRDTLPNYDLVPEMLKDLRRVPFVGKFFSFMSESVRISQGSLRRAHKEITTGKQLIAEGAPEAGKIIRNRGTTRLASFTVVGGLGAKGIELGSQAVYGVSKDVVEAARDMLPDYMQNANLFVTVKEDGTPAVGNISSWDAYDFPKKPLQILSKKILSSDGSDTEALYKEIFTILTTEMVTPFIGESLIQEQLSNYVFSDGITNSKKLMRNPFNRAEQYDNSGTQLENALNKDNLNILMANLFQTVLPGTIDRGIDWAKTLDKEQTSFDQDIYPVDQAMKFLTGWGTQPLNKEYVENVFSFKASSLSKEKGFRRNRLYNAIDKDFDSDKFINNYLKENEKYAKSYAKTHKLIKSGNTFNLDTNKLLKEAGFSEADRITLRLSDTYKPLGLTQNTLNLLKQSVSSATEYKELIQDINVIDSSLSNMPIIFDPEIYKASSKETLEDLRDEYKTGGLVPNVEENPEDRINPVTGQTYEETRLGFSAGGGIDNVLAENLFGIDAKWQRAHEKETAQLVNKKIDEGVFPSRARVPVNPTTGNVEGRIPDEEIFNTVNHQRLSYKIGDTGFKRAGLQLREALSLANNVVKRTTGKTKQETFLRQVQDDKVDFLNNRIGFDLNKRNLTAEDAENEIINNTIKRFNLKGK